jgi:hypothetical protein
MCGKVRVVLKWPLVIQYDRWSKRKICGLQGLVGN